MAHVHVYKSGKIQEFAKFDRYLHDAHDANMNRLAGVEFPSREIKALSNCEHMYVRWYARTCISICAHMRVKGANGKHSRASTCASASVQTDICTH